MCFHTGELTKTNPRSNPRTNSFGGKVVCTKASARDRPPLGAIPASAGISPIGGQSPFESLVRNTFPPKPFHDPRGFWKCFFLAFESGRFLKRRSSFWVV